MVWRHPASSLIARCEHPEAGESCGSRMSGEITVGLAALLNEKLHVGQERKESS